MASVTDLSSSGGGAVPVADPTAPMTSEQHLARSRELMRMAEKVIKSGCGLDWAWQYAPLITAHIQIAKEIDRQKVR